MEKKKKQGLGAWNAAKHTYFLPSCADQADANSICWGCQERRLEAQTQTELCQGRDVSLNFAKHVDVTKIQSLCPCDLWTQR